MRSIGQTKIDVGVFAWGVFKTSVEKSCVMGYLKGTLEGTRMHRKPTVSDATQPTKAARFLLSVFELSAELF